MNIHHFKKFITRYPNPFKRYKRYEYKRNKSNKIVEYYRNMRKIMIKFKNDIRNFSREKFNNYIKNIKKYINYDVNPTIYDRYKNILNKRPETPDNKSGLNTLVNTPNRINDKYTQTIHDKYTQTINDKYTQTMIDTSTQTKINTFRKIYNKFKKKK